MFFSMLYSNLTSSVQMCLRTQFSVSSRTFFWCGYRFCWFLTFVGCVLILNTLIYSAVKLCQMVFIFLERHKWHRAIYETKKSIIKCYFTADPFCRIQINKCIYLLTIAFLTGLLKSILFCLVT